MKKVKVTAMAMRLPAEVKASMMSEAQKEKKSLIKYIIDAHISHCHTKYNAALTCPQCDAENVRAEKIICWNCGKKY